MSSVLVVSPHPDDEVLGAGATLALLASHGWRIVNLACSLGRPADHSRRRRELFDAAERIGFETVVMDPLAAISGADDPVRAEDDVANAVISLVAELSPDLVVSPHPRDRHHGHEMVGRGVRRALTQIDRELTWWMWGLWGELPNPTLYVPFDEEILRTVAHALDAHAGENARNAYDRLLPARAITATVLGTERIFGFGSPQADPAPYAELLTELSFGGVWRTGAPRVLNPSNPLIGEFYESESAV